VAVNPDAIRAGGPASPARPLVVSRARTSRRIALDRWTSRLVILGGIIIIAAILAILFVIAAEVYPLFKAPTVALLGTYAAPGGAPTTPASAEATGVDEYRELAYAVTSIGTLQLASLKDKTSPAPIPIPPLGDSKVTTVAATGAGRHLIGTTDGRAIPLEVQFDVAFKDGGRTVTPKAVIGEPLAMDPERKRPLRRIAFAATPTGPLTVAQVGPTELAVLAVTEKKALVGGTTRAESLQPLVASTDGEITALRLDGRGEDLFVGTSQGRVLRYDMRDRTSPAAMESVTVARDAGTQITALGFLLGDRTLVVGDARGQVSTWQVVPPPQGGDPRLTRVYEFAPHAGPVVTISASKRDKGFVTADAAGQIHLSYGTSGQTLISSRAPAGDLRSVVFAPKTDGIVSVDGKGAWSQWQVNNPHPEITLKTVFGKVWYEGYAKPEYVWQSTGGTDDFEAKFSLTPLIYGTLKGTFYALLFAIPLALLAATYVSEFMHPTVKGYVKPVVEIMAALPSVVLGFLAGLWLAPMIERVVPGLFLLPLVLTTCILAAFAAWRTLPMRFRGHFKTGTEVFLLLPVVILSAWIAFALGGLVEATLLGGSYRGWLLSALGLTYDQRNSLVVGVAMGFAVIPIIFTIAEDSLANVPQHLRAGSLALGATRWQTALRIVLPTASPGIFSAIMIGFGRAVGETMIVLMATGNTPVMDWSIFNGFRALSANIAVELPEAPEGGTLFRVLFLAAFLLFCLTFAVNTVAELVRLKLRQKYRYL
jgi:phosphate transport system permease protein